MSVVSGSISACFSLDFTFYSLWKRTLLWVFYAILVRLLRFLSILCFKIRIRSRHCSGLVGFMAFGGYFFLFSIASWVFYSVKTNASWWKNATLGCSRSFVLFLFDLVSSISERSRLWWDKWFWGFWVAIFLLLLIFCFTWTNIASLSCQGVFERPFSSTPLVLAPVSEKNCVFVLELQFLFGYAFQSVKNAIFGSYV